MTSEWFVYNTQPNRRDCEVQQFKPRGSGFQRQTKAIVHFREAVRFGPNYATGLANLGNAFCQLGQFDEGIKHYEQALRLMPDYARAHYNLGHALLEKERYEEAILHLREAGRLDPRQLSDVEHDIAIAEARRQQLQEAMDKTDP